jgi:uncharacterized protein (DUF1330 family)
VLSTARRNNEHARILVGPPTGEGMPAYLIVNYEVEDRALYGEYAKAAGPAMKVGSECQLIAFDPATDRFEGDAAGRQTVILQFDSKEQAKAIYESGEYQAVIGKRLKATSQHFAILVQGIAR